MGTAGGQGLNHFKPVPTEMCAKQTQEMYDPCVCGFNKLSNENQLAG